jgi:isopentenyldiphosphate isomerase
VLGILVMEEEQELLDVVDEKDKFIGKDTKENKLLKGFISRNVAVFILDESKKLLTVKRSPDKKSFPNRYDLAVCGDVKAGEKYPEAAQRELMEKLGIKCSIKHLGKIFNEFKENDKKVKYFTCIFLGRYAGKVKLNDELVELKRLSIKNVEELVEKDRYLFTPSFFSVFMHVRDKLK